MMSYGILQELQVVGTAFVCGAVITLVYDVLRIFRRVFSHGNFWIGAEDFFFWIWTSFWIFSVLYRENDGAFRLYTILAMVLGMIVYHGTVSELFVKILGNGLRKFVNVLVYPLKMLKIPIIFLGKKLKNRIQRIIMKRQNRKVSEDALGGIGYDEDETKKNF